MQKSLANTDIMDWIIGTLCASDRDLTSCSISKAAFLRLSYDRSPSERWTIGGRGDSTETRTGPDLDVEEDNDGGTCCCIIPEDDMGEEVGECDDLVFAGAGFFIGGGGGGGFGYCC